MGVSPWGTLRCSLLEAGGSPWPINHGGHIVMLEARHGLLTRRDPPVARHGLPPARQLTAQRYNLGDLIMVCCSTLAASRIWQGGSSRHQPICRFRCGPQCHPSPPPNNIHHPQDSNNRIQKPQMNEINRDRYLPCRRSRGRVAT